MKFIHTADLHLGKQMNDLSILEDQEAALSQIVSIAEAEGADAVLISGDVYQRSSPQAEAMALFDSFVTRLKEAGKKVFVISGNHDSALRVSYFSTLVREAGIYVSQAFHGALQRVALEDEEGEVNIWMLPFLRTSQARRYLPGERIATCQQAVEAVLRGAPVDKSRRNVLMAHQFVTGCDPSDSEEKMVGGLEAVDPSVFDGFDYVALGHIHRPQRLLRDSLRYAGSPLKYSFSEAGDIKSVSVVELGRKGEVDVRTVPLYPRRDVRLVEGMLEEVSRMPYSEDYVWVTVHDELVPPDARAALTVTFPNMLKFSVVNSRTRWDMDVLATQRMEEKTIPELFADFYRLMNNDQAPGPAHMKALEKALRDMEESGGMDA